MKNLLNAAVCATIVLSATASSFAGGYQHLLDPVVTHTNGMRLASTTSSRSHNVYWQCDPGHIGYCDGEYNTPCTREWAKLGTRCCGRYVPPYTPSTPLDTVSGHSMDGLETTSGESLGMISIDPDGAGQPAARAPRAPVAAPSAVQPPAAPAGSGGIWLDAIKTLGSKMTGPDG